MPRNKYHDTLVAELHEAFGAPIAWMPVIPPEARRRLRCELLLEEVFEFVKASGFTLVGPYGAHKLEATHEPDIVEAADGLADVRVITDGSNLEWGFPGEKLLREVHRSNMSKLGPDGRPIYRADGKVLKGPNYTPPAIKEILDLYQGIQNGQ